MTLEKRPLVGLLSLSLALITLALIQTQAVYGQAQRRRTTQPPPTPPTIQLSADKRILTNCVSDPSRAVTNVILTTATSNFSGTALRYSWQASGGRIVGTGANTTWDLTGVQPGTYTAHVEVVNADAPDCVAFSSLMVRVKDCPPPPISCPNITIYCPENVTVGQPVTFTATVTGGTPGVTPIYNWSITNGTIISGQGTSSITVDTAGLAGQSITATLDVGGYNLTCPASCMAQIPLVISPRKFDEFPDIAFDDEKARLDNLAVQLQSEPDATGYIIVYGSRRGRANEAATRAKRARDYLVNTRGLDARRIVTMDGGVRDQLAVELWIVPQGAAPPTPRP